MKTAIVGAGKGCRSLLEFILERGLSELKLDVALVCDRQEDAPGVLFARERGIPTCAELPEVMNLPGLEMVVELTGNERVAEEIYHRVPPGVRVMDHVMARLFWDLLHAERQLRFEREQVQEILDSMPDIVFVLDREMRIQAVNAEFVRLSGLSREEASGMRCHDALCGTEETLERPGITCPLGEVLRTGKRMSLVQVTRGRDGGEEHYEVTISPLRREGGKIDRLVESRHPVNERVRLKREVEESNWRFRRLIDSARDFISMKDREGRYLVMNAATAELFDMWAYDCVGKTVHELYPPEIARLISQHDREAMERKKHITYEETLVLKGREYHLKTERFPLRDYKGDVVGVCTISRDVTEERRLQHELIQADKLAAVGKLAAGVAHEINNPLTGILAYAEDLLEDAGEADPRAEDYRVIVRETLRCREIVRNLLDFALQTTPRKRRVDLNEVADNVLALVSKLALFKDITIRERLPEGLPSVFGDPQQLQQVLLNLMVNAAEMMGGAGGIRIATGFDPDDRTCRISVSDTGPGVPEEAMGRLFEPFFSTKATHGLGLAVSWGIVERHGGRIEVENLAEGGARFRVVLPVMEVD